VIIRQTAVKMGELLDNLLDVSRMESGTFAIVRDAVPPIFLAEAMERLFATRAAEKQVAWSVDVAADLPHIVGDAHRLEQVLSNLLGNALKFTPAGGRIALTGAARAEGIELAVEDTGPGIPPEHMERLFDRFWKADPASRNGAGLGLAIARGIVEAHGGRLSVESVLGAGTTFRMVLPRAT
jgi:signal transduction histidine kinase